MQSSKKSVPSYCLLCVFILLSGCRAKTDQLSSKQEPGALFSFDSEGMDDAVFRNYDKGVLNCTVVSSKVLTDSGGNTILFSEPKVTISDKDGGTFVSAKTGKYLMSEERIFLESRVYAYRKQDDTKLYSDNLRWEKAQKKIYITGPVRQVSGGNTVTGTGLVADEDLNNITILENVRVEINKT